METATGFLEALSETIPDMPADSQQSAQDCLALLQNDMENPEPWFTLGDLVFKLDQWPEALACYEIVFEKNPEHNSHLSNKIAYCHYRLEHPRTAKKYLFYTIKHSTNNEALAYAYGLLSELALKAKNIRLGRYYLERFLSLPEGQKGSDLSRLGSLLTLEPPLLTEGIELMEKAMTFEFDSEERRMEARLLLCSARGLDYLVSKKYRQGLKAILECREIAWHLHKIKYEGFASAITQLEKMDRFIRFFKTFGPVTVKIPSHNTQRTKRFYDNWKLKKSRRDP